MHLERFSAIYLCAGWSDVIAYINPCNIIASTAAGLQGRNSRQLLAQAPSALAACESPSWQCQVNATHANIVPQVYDLIRAAPQNCTALSNSMLCGSYLLDLGLFNAITAGACQFGCPSTEHQDCAAPPTPALPYAAFTAVEPLPAPVVAPALPPAVAPAPALAPECPRPPRPGCSRWEHVCGAQRQYRISDAQYSAMQAAHSCAADLDVSFCFVGRCTRTHLSNPPLHLVYVCSFNIVAFLNTRCMISSSTWCTSQHAWLLPTLGMTMSPQQRFATEQSVKEFD